MAEILIADDDRLIREGMKALFAGEGFSVRTARDGEDALKKFAESRPDLVLLDVMMPKANGFKACEEIRRLDRLVPIVFLTAKDSEADEVRGIGLGADDYVSKTAGEAVLVARVRRALERAAAIDAEVSPPRVLQLGAVTVDFDRLTVSGSGADGRLTRTEADILQLLALRAGSPMTGDELIAALRGEGYACEDSMLYSHVSHLRRKLGPAGCLLANDRSTGYRLMR